MADVFVSYKAEDRERIAPLVQALETDGLSVWWDAHIGGGDAWRETILRHLQSAKCVMVIWSRRSVGPKGEFVRDEASRALKRKTYLPIRIDKVDPPLGFGETQALDLVGWKGDVTDPRYAAVLAGLRGRFGLKVRRQRDPGGAPTGVSRRAAIAGGAAAAIVAAGGGAWFFLRPSAAQSNSIAVLPFANLSGDPAQSYFSDGIAEELRGDLSRIPGLKVVARTSSEVVRNEDAKAAAHKLAVSHILTGSVRRSASLLRVDAQLVDADGLEQWSEAYDRRSGDVLQIQTDIANSVADALRIRLARVDNSWRAEGGTRNSDAQDLLLRAQALLEHGQGRTDVGQALGLLNAALSLDPQYADALALKATALMTVAGMFSASAAESQQHYRVAAATARSAMRIAPRSRAGYAALAAILYQQLYIRAALEQYRQVIAIPGNDADLVMYAVNLSEVRRPEQALSLIDRAIAADPLNPQSYGWKAYILANARRYSDAAATVQIMIDQDPKLLWARGFHAHCLMMLGDNAAARREFDSMGNDALRVAAADVGALGARQGDPALTNQVLAWLRAYASDAAYYQFGEIYAQQGKKDEAIDALQKAWVARDPGLSGSLVDPLLDPLRNDTRFQALIKKLDFPT